MPWPDYTLGDSGSGRDFTTGMESAEAGMQGDWGANSGNSPVTLSCDAFTEVTSSGVVWDGWSPLPTDVNTVTVQAAAGAGHGGVWGQSYLFQLTAGFVFSQEILIPYLRFRGISAEATNASGRDIFENINHLPGVEISNVMGRYSGGAKRTNFYFVHSADLVRNCQFEITNGGDAYGIYTVSPATVENCTLICPAATLVGIRRGGGDALVRNNVTVWGTTGYSSGTYLAGSTNNAGGSTEVTTLGIGTVDNVSLVDGVDFIEPSTGNYNPQPGGKLEGAGANLSADFTDDITGYTRPGLPDPWCIGAYEIQGAAPGVSFDGPNILAQTGTEDVLFSFQENGGGTVASRFTGATAYALAPTSDALPTGLTINEITGNIEGTPTVAGEFTNIIIEGSEQPLFNFNGTDQYATHTAWECLGDPAVYESVTYGADPDDGFIIGAARPITEIGRVGANYHAGPAWGVQYNDSSPIQDTDALMGSGFRYIVIPQFTIPAGDDFEISADVIRGSATLNEYIFGSPNRNDDSYVVYAVGGGGTSSAAIILGGEVLTVPDAAFDSVAEGQHYRMSYRRTSGLVEAFVNDVFASSKVMNGEHIVSAFMSGASTHAQNTFQSGAMQNVILENLTTQEYVRYAIDEGEGLSVKAYDRSGDEIPASAGTITPDADWQNIPNNSRHYPMNEGTGATLFDTVGGHDATIQNFTDEWQ